MALWLYRAGKIGQFETKFIEDKAIYCTWDGLDWNMSKYDDRDVFKEMMRQTYPDICEGTLNSWTGQVWAFSHRMMVGDIIALPRKIKRAIQFGEVLSDYSYNHEEEIVFRHSRKIKWLKEIPRENVDKDILFSLGASQTICKIERNNAEQRIREQLGKPITSVIPETASESEDDEQIESIDIEETAFQEIADRLIAKYSGHGLAKVVAAILEAKGYKCLVSPPGPDNGVDILASKGSLGFDPPRVCVQVKSGDAAQDRPTLDQLVGAMSNHKAEFGMLVSWGGFKKSVTREEAHHFFKVRLWSHKDIIQEFLNHYGELPEEIKETIPLKRIWIIDNKDI